MKILSFSAISQFMRSIKVEEMEQILKKENSNILIINVLSEADFKKEHIPRSINIPLKNSDFITQVKKHVIDKNAPIIVYCDSSQCSTSEEAAKILEKEGFTNIMDFKGGMEEWRQVSKTQKD